MAPFALLHVPHSSKNIPEDARASLKLTEKELINELLKMTDSYTNELFRCDPQLTRDIVFPISRLVVDPERFLDDEKEEMAKKGMGVVYTKTSGGQDLRSSLMPEDKEHLINQYYKPHHAELERAVGAAFKNWGACLVIDCHSFPSIPLSYEFDQSTDRPDICLGTDSFHTPDWLLKEAKALFQANGFRVMVDRPFSGTLVPFKYFQKNPSLWSIMIEVNRSLYMSEVSWERLPIFIEFSKRLQGIIRSLVLVAKEESKKTLAL